MKCEWDKLISILPGSLRRDVDRLGKSDLQELRIRQGKPIQLVLHNGSRLLKEIGTADHMNTIVNAASRYSPWAAESISQGYITAPGGHRIGICGEAIIREGTVTGIRNPTSLCVRVARDFPGAAGDATGYRGNILILGPPGAGKTTLLRDMIRQISNRGKGSVTVVDERGELFPIGSDFDTGLSTDVLTGCTKPQGVDMALKTMGPAVIAVDEITSEPDCDAVRQALWCGVRVLATVHANSRQDLQKRRVYRKLTENGIFDTLLILRPDKSWIVERTTV